MYEEDEDESSYEEDSYEEETEVCFFV